MKRTDISKNLGRLSVGQQIVGTEPFVRISDAQIKKHLRLWRRKITRKHHWNQKAANKPRPLSERNSLMSKLQDRWNSVGRKSKSLWVWSSGTLKGSYFGLDILWARERNNQAQPLFWYKEKAVLWDSLNTENFWSLLHL